jgi:hypothetical protein
VGVGVAVPSTSCASVAVYPTLTSSPVGALVPVALATVAKVPESADDACTKLRVLAL